MSLLPVPRRPATCHVSSMRYSPSSRRNERKSAIPPAPRALTTAPTLTPRQWSQPEENDQRPDTRYPPSTSTALPVGLYDDECIVVGSLPHSACCASSSNRASCHGWTPITPATQPTDGLAFDSSKIASRNSTSSTSPPPHRRGCSARRK